MATGIIGFVGIGAGRNCGGGSGAYGNIVGPTGTADGNTGAGATAGRIGFGTGNKCGVL